MTAASLDNKGKIQLTGSGASQALLDVTGSAGFGAAGVLTGNVDLSGDSAVEFKSGQITSLAGSLDLNGNDAFIEDSTATGSSSALTGLASIGAGATFALHDGAAVSTTGSLVNDGHIHLDTNAGEGGSNLSIGGALTNSGNIVIGDRYAVNLSASDKVTATSLDNTGSISLTGSTTADQALLDVTAGSAGFGAAGVLSGSVTLFSGSAIEFASGHITSLAAGATLDLFGGFIEDSTALGSNSALTGLASIGAGATFSPYEVSTTGALVNDGNISGSSLTVGGTLTNNGTISDYGAFTATSFDNVSTIDCDGAFLSTTGAFANSGTLSLYNDNPLSENCSVTANSFVNSGVVGLRGGYASDGRTTLSALNVSGTLTNKGSISIILGSGEFGAVGGAGSFSLTGGADLQFDSSVSAGQTINETGLGDGLTLKEAQSFAATISGFGTTDTIDATNFLKTKTTYDFVENSMGTGGTLTLTDASLTASILMTGDYSNSSFSLAHDSGTVTLVKFV